MKNCQDDIWLFLPMYSLYCTLYIVYCTLYIVYCTLYILNCTLYIVYCTLYILNCTLYIVYCTLYTVHCILYTVYCTLFTVHCTRYTAHCILCNVHCTALTTKSIYNQPVFWKYTNKKSQMFELNFGLFFWVVLFQRSFDYTWDFLNGFLILECLKFSTSAKLDKTGCSLARWYFNSKLV